MVRLTRAPGIRCRERRGLGGPESAAVSGGGRRPEMREVAKLGCFRASRLSWLGEEEERSTAELPGGSARHGEARGDGAVRRPSELGFARAERGDRERMRE